MEITQTPEYMDAMMVMTSGDSGSALRWNMEILTGGVDKDNKPVVVNPLWINYVFNRKDGVIAFADELQVSFHIGAGTYTKKILPFRDLLIARLTRVDLQKEENDEDSADMLDTTFVSADESQSGYSEKRVEMVYTAIIADKGQNPTVAQGREDDTEDALNLASIIEVKMQLFHPAVEQLKGILVGGVVRGSTIYDIMINYMSMAKEKINTEDKTLIETIDISPVNNSDIHEQILIPHNLPVYELPRFLQQRYGVYSAGCGTYIDSKTWYVYPIYNTNKYEDKKIKTTVFIMPKKKFPQVEHTYARLDDGSSMIVCTGETGFKDDSGSQYLKYGNGAKYTDVQNLADGAKSENNKSIYLKETTSKTFVNEQRKNGVNIVKPSSNKMTSNPYQVYSQVASRSGSLLKFVWQNSCMDLITVGEPIKIVYCDEDKIKNLYGTIAYIAHASQNLAGAANDRWTNQSIVQAFVREEAEQGEDQEPTDEQKADALI